MHLKIHFWRMWLHMEGAFASQWMNEWMTQKRNRVSKWHTMETVYSLEAARVFIVVLDD